MTAAGTMVAYGREGTVCVRSLGSSRPSAERVLGQGSDEVRDVTFSLRGDRLASLHRSGEIRIWSMAGETADPLRVPRGLEYQFALLRFDPQGRLVTRVYLRQLCGNEEDAADLTQQTSAKVCRALATSQGRSSFNPWLHGIGHHVCVDCRRKRRAGYALSDEWCTVQSSNNSGPFEDAEEGDLALQLCHWLDELDEEKKQAVHLH